MKSQQKKHFSLEFSLILDHFVVKCLTTFDRFVILLQNFPCKGWYYFSKFKVFCRFLSTQEALWGSRSPTKIFALVDYISVSIIKWIGETFFFADFYAVFF